MGKLILTVLVSTLLFVAYAVNSCGTSYTDSKKCATRCPSGTDSECPPGERCFANIPCSSQSSTVNSCGTSYTDSKKCATRCPSGTDSECPPGERCFANVPCSNTPPPAPTQPPGSPSGGFIVNEQQFNQMFPQRNQFYTYRSLASAAASFPGFAKTGSSTTRKREAAAFLANIAHESGDLRYITELNQANWRSYCDPSTARANGFTSDCKKNGREFLYYGRGPIQLSWNFNYLAAGRALNTDLINNPNLVQTNPEVAWKTAVWFWMSSKGAGSMTPHSAITSGSGFGETIRSINGALECNGKRPDLVAARVRNYRRFVGLLGTSVGGGRIDC